jgi:hypothetical protein
MKVLLDECSPAPLRKVLTKVEVATVDMAGLKGMSNGQLIAAIEGKFDVLITADKNLRYQQRLTGRKLAIIELPHNSWPKLTALVPAIEAALSRIQPGEYFVIPLEPTII